MWPVAGGGAGRVDIVLETFPDADATLREFETKMERHQFGPIRSTGGGILSEANRSGTKFLVRNIVRDILLYWSRYCPGRQRPIAHTFVEFLTEVPEGDALPCMHHHDPEEAAVARLRFLEVMAPSPQAGRGAMSFDQRTQISAGVAKLSANDRSNVVSLVQACSRTLPEDGGEIEIDINALDHATLWRLFDFLQACKAPKPTVRAPSDPAKFLPRLASFTNDELKGICRSNGIAGFSCFKKKADLVDFIKKYYGVAPAIGEPVSSTSGARPTTAASVVSASSAAVLVPAPAVYEPPPAKRSRVDESPEAAKHAKLASETAAQLAHAGGSQISKEDVVMLLCQKGKMALKELIRLFKPLMHSQEDRAVFIAIVKEVGCICIEDDQKMVTSKTRNQPFKGPQAAAASPSAAPLVAATAAPPPAAALQPSAMQCIEELD